MKVKKWGNSLGIIIPKKIVEKLGLSEEDIADIDIEKKERISGFGLCKGAPPYKEEKEIHEEWL